MNPRISIVIPVYNTEERLLRQCIQSCKEQTEKNIEIIVVDDGSKTETALLCDALSKGDSRIFVIHKPRNCGLSAARNTGVRAAKGTWVAFLDGDDYLERDFCEYEKTVPHDVDMAFFAIVRDNGDNKEYFPFAYEDGRIFEGEECVLLQGDMLDYDKRLSTVPAKLIKRSLMTEKNIYHDETTPCGIEGIEFNLRLFGEIKKAMALKKYVYHYVFADVSITAAPDEKKCGYIIQSLEKMTAYAKNSPNKEILIPQLNKRIRRIVMDWGVGGYFSPNSHLMYKEACKKTMDLINSKVVLSAIEQPAPELKGAKKLVYTLTVKKRFFMLYILGRVRLIWLNEKKRRRRKHA